MKQRKKLFSWILVLSMVIMMVPLNVFAANLENTTDFEYSPPEDIIIYKNETKKVEISNYVYSSGESYSLESISVKSDNANVEVTQPSKGKMKVKGLEEGISIVTIQYSWIYNGKNETGTSSFKVTVKEFQYCWELEGDSGYYDLYGNNDLYIGESKEWNVILRKVYYKENGEQYRQKIKNFDIITKVYRRIENEDEEADTWYKEIVDNSLLTIDIDNTDNSIIVRGKAEAECYLDIQVQYQGQNIKIGDGDDWGDEEKETRKFNVKKESYEILENSSAYRPMGEGDRYPEFRYLLVGQKVKVKFQLIHIYYDELTEKRKTESLSNVIVKAYYSQKESGEFHNVELSSTTKSSEHAEMSFENNTLTIKGMNADLEEDEDVCEECVDLDAYIDGKKVETSGVTFEITKSLESEGRFDRIYNFNNEDEYEEEYVHLKKNASKKVDIGYFSVEGYSWNWDKDEPYEVDSIEVMSSDASVATSTVPKIDEDGDYYCTFKGKKSGNAIITFKYTYTFNDILYTGSQRVEVIVGYNPYTTYQLKLVKDGLADYRENEENSSEEWDYLEMRNPYNTTLKAKVYKVCGDDDGNITKTEIENFTLKCEEYADEEEYEKEGTIKATIDNNNQSIEFLGESKACCVYKISFELNDKIENQYDKKERYIEVYGNDYSYYTVGDLEDSSDNMIMLKEGETFPINVYRHDSEHPSGIKVNDSIAKMKSSGKGLEIDNSNKTVTAKQTGRVQLKVIMDECDDIKLNFCIIPKSDGELNLGKEEKLEEEGDTFVFIPKKTGQYKLLEIFKDALYENDSEGIEVFDSTGNKVESYGTDSRYKKAIICIYNLEEGKTYYFSYDTCYSYNGYTGSRGDMFRTSPEKIRLTYIENEEQECTHRDSTKYTVKNIKAKTCTGDGYSGDVYCSECGQKIEEGKVLKATGHQWDKGIITKMPTETEDGIKTFTCTICKKTKKESVKASGSKANKKPSNPTNLSNIMLKVGTKITDKSSKATYKVTGKYTVEYMKDNSKKKAVVIPDNITVGKIKYQVTSIAINAFKGNKQLRSIVISTKIRKIGKQSFFKCKNLKKIVIKTPYLSKKTVGVNAFKGIYTKATIKVPKKQKKAYQKLLRLKGVGKKVKVK